MTRIKELRKEKGVKQHELANAVSVSIQTISGYENNYAQPPIDVLIKIADYFEVSTDYLLKRTDDLGIISTNANLTLYESNLLAVVAKLSKEDQFQVLGFAQALAQ